MQYTVLALCRLCVIYRPVSNVSSYTFQLFFTLSSLYVGQLHLLSLVSYYQYLCRAIEHDWILLLVPWALFSVVKDLSGRYRLKNTVGISPRVKIRLTLLI